MSFIDLNFSPIPRSTYSDSEINHELISSSKAFHFCKPYTQAFYSCRKTPQGRVIDPESCLDLASDLIQCYSYIKQVPKSCESEYSSIKSCLDRNNGQCSGQMQIYIDCVPKDFTHRIRNP